MSNPYFPLISPESKSKTRIYKTASKNKSTMFNNYIPTLAENHDSKINLDEKIRLEQRTQKLMGNRLKPKTSHNYFHGHECYLDAQDLSVYYIQLNLLWRFIFNLTTVRSNDFRTLTMYRSYATLSAEKYRHYTCHPFSIHPFSKLRSFVEISVFTIMIFQGILFACHYAEKNAGLKDLHVKFIYFSDFTYIIHILLNFCTGYIQGQCQKVAIMDWRKIACNYIKTWLLMDVLSAMTFMPILVTTYNRNPTLYFVSEAAKLLRLPRCAIYFKIFLQNLDVSLLKKTIIEVLTCIVTYLSWNIYFQFALEYVIEGTSTPIKPRNCSWLTYGKMWDQPWIIRISFALERGVGMLTTNTNIKVIEDLGCFEAYFVISWFIAQILMFHFALKYVIFLFGSESARAKYYIMQKQVQYYMVQRKLPERLKKKILKFYAIRFHSKYFTEARVLGAMSGQLHDDILMHKGRQIIKDLDFLKLLPRPLLMQIIFKLKGVIFIAGDIIYKINTIGDCLYFVDKGTVALYTDSAQEVCHVEDGDFFGLCMHDRFRSSSAVAVTNCELYRLDKEDFDTTIAHYPTVLEIITKMGLEKFEKVSVADEHRKADMRYAEKVDH